jgi:hypothetical protein
VKIATPSEALAHSVLHGQPVIPEEVVIGGEQQPFLDARVYEGTELPFIDWGDDIVTILQIENARSIS